MPQATCASALEPTNTAASEYVPCSFKDALTEDLPAQEGHGPQAVSLLSAYEIRQVLAEPVELLRAEFSPGRWTAPLAVLWDGEPAGVQELFGDKYLVNRTTETGSWLARRFQGRGIGTATRQVIAAFAFDHLDAQYVTSAAFRDNVASVSVSRKVGYTENGVDIWAREGKPVPHQRFLLSPGNLVRYEHPLMVSGLGAFRRSIGLDG
jgi:RimJ/RimL family protein N-acetyltransferase